MRKGFLVRRDFVWRRWGWVGSCCLWAAAAWAHEEPKPTAADAPAAAHEFPRALLLPQIEGPKPWTDKPVFNDPNRFQIAVMTDNTGGHRPGIWMKAIEKINLMRPEFVMSVGDLIEGYSENRRELRAQWREFLGFMDRMQMKFFFVAGNHDLSNPVMHQMWRERFGPKWYSFDYKGVHFVCLSSEEPATALGEEQLAWVTKDLAEHADARWTLVFMHKPLWFESERARAAGNRDGTGWQQLEAQLGSRPHTVFAGHVHHYCQFDRNGMQYYQLATTGGASPLRGVPYGEFDHIVWLTMESDGPHVANLLLDGVLAGNTVNEKAVNEYRQFVSRPVLEAAPILVADADGFSSGRIDLRLTNGFQRPVKITAKIVGLPLSGVTLDQEALLLAAEPGQTTELAVGVRFAAPMSFERLGQTALVAQLKTADKDAPLSAELSLPIVIDQRFDLPRRAAPAVVDGKLDEWEQLPQTMTAQPLVLEPTGTADARVSFAAAYDEQFVYLAAHVADGVVSSEGDALQFQLDLRPIATRRRDPRQLVGTYTLRIAPPDEQGQCEVAIRGPRKSPIYPGTVAKGRRTADGYEVEAAVPLKFVTAQQGAGWHSLQLTPVIFDQDLPGQKPARVVWRGTPEVSKANLLYGQFVRGS